MLHRHLQTAVSNQLSVGTRFVISISYPPDLPKKQYPFIMPSWLVSSTTSSFLVRLLSWPARNRQGGCNPTGVSIIKEFPAKGAKNKVAYVPV